MPLLDEYQNLLKNTLSSLKNIDEKYVESNSDFFEKDLLNFSSKKTNKPNQSVLYEKKKYNVNVSPSEIPTNVEKKEIQKDQVEKPQNIKTQINDNEKIKEPDKTKDIGTKPTKPLSSTSETLIKKDEIKVKESLKKKEIENKKVIREEKPKIFEDSFTDIKKSIEKVFPNISILEKPIDDKLAKQKSQKYKLKNISSTITILAYKEDEKLYRFLEKLSTALGVYFYPSKVVSAYLIEKENSWDDFLNSDISLIISSDYTIFELKHLRTFYRENPSKQEKHLKNIPLFLLPDIFLYLKEPSLKKSLFNALKQKISDLKNDK
ncbi:MAG TPA: hypothetical protein ENH96_04430 [Chlamydiae bacterium]|nr:hypothetical protein [Candidatus Anoxychlamydiales bacterium]HEU64615.1 hypothetical protein [Chlamydiota bacterium]